MMRSLTTSTAAGMGALVLGFTLSIGCSDSSLSSTSNPNFSAAVESYDVKVEQTLTTFTNLAETIVAFDAAMKAGQDADPIADQQLIAIGEFLASIRALEEVETNLQGDTSPGRITQPVIAQVLGVGLIVLGLWAYGQECDSRSQRVSGHRSDRDVAIEGMGNADPDAIDAFSNAVDGMQSEGEDAVEDLGARVTTELVLGPIKPTSVGGVILKDRAGNKLKNRVKVLAATKACSNSPTSPECRIALQRTDAGGRVEVPAGKLSVLISLDGYVRMVANDVDVVAGTDTVIQRNLIPVADATPENVAANDAGGVVGDTDAGIPPGDSGPEGPAMETLAGGWFGIVRRDGEVDFYLTSGAGASDIAVRRYVMVDNGGTWTAAYEWLDCGTFSSPQPLFLATVPCSDGGTTKQDGFGVLRAQGGVCSDLLSDSVGGGLIASALMSLDGSCTVSPFWDPSM